VIRLAAPRKGKRRWWAAEEARRFLECARHGDDPLYATYVLVLVLGLRRGEALGLTWELANLDIGELYISEQVQRVSGQLVRRPAKTESSEAPLPGHRAQAPQGTAGRRPGQRWRRLDRHGPGVHHLPRQVDRTPELQPQLRPSHRQGRSAQDPRARHGEVMRPPAGRARCAPAWICRSSATRRST